MATVIILLLLWVVALEQFTKELNHRYFQGQQNASHQGGAYAKLVALALKSISGPTVLVLLCLQSQDVQTSGLSRG